MNADPRKFIMIAIGGLAFIFAFATFAVVSDCGPAVNYVETVDGRCLKVIGGGLWQVTQHEVAAAECQRRRR